VGLLGDVRAMLADGKIGYDVVLPLMQKLAQDPNRLVVEATVQVVGHLRDSELIAEPSIPRFAKFIRDTYGKRARQLGWKPKKGEDEDTRLLRQLLLPLVADRGEDAGLGAEATKLAGRWLTDRSSIEPELIGDVLDVTAQRGDAGLFDAWLATAKGEKDRAERRRLLWALSGFRDPALIDRSLALTLAGDFEIRESIDLLWGATRTPAGRRKAYQFVKASFDDLIAKLPRDDGARLEWVASQICDDAARKDADEFFSPRATKLPGGPRVLAQALESIHLCAAWKTAQAPSAERFLATKR
jgi:alanyl aminopeptidase